MITIFTADCIGKPSNCLYPHRTEVTDKASLAAAVSRDYVCAEYRNSYRNNENFVGSNCLPMDCDNDHSNEPESWVYPSDVADKFPGVAFAVHYSRFHMREKNGKAARPKFHVLFSIEPTTDAGQYSQLKKRVSTAFPFFDTRAMDSARFFFGTEPPEVELFPGPMTLTAFFQGADFGAAMDAMNDSRGIPEGQRNSTLSHLAGKLLKRLGDTEEAWLSFLKNAEKCTPPLEDRELVTIWQSAQKFYSRVAAQPGYVPPEEYNRRLTLKPSDFSDVGQAVVLAHEYENVLRYSPATDYIVFNGSFWDESAPKAQAVAQALTDRQLAEAETEMTRMEAALIQNGGWSLLALGPKKAAAEFTAAQADTASSYQAAVSYRNYAIKRRNSGYLTSALQVAQPKLLIDQKELDANAYLFNTPSFTYDLRAGLASRREHDPKDYITKQTAVDPSSEGKELWWNALNTFFCNDAALISYVQEIAGLAAFGRVYLEALIIAYGGGRNGKSTFWNTIARTFGSYSGSISADALTVGCKRNIKPELAEARGKRLLIASELEEGVRLNASIVKQLCSTDMIFAEKKYKDPFSFEPSHTLVLYTNHLPKVGGTDEGIWRRLIVVPFTASIKGKRDIKNYTNYLYENAGGAVLSWVIEGAQRIYARGFELLEPPCVARATSKYREDNDWLSDFFDTCCELGKGYEAKSGEVYNSYRAFCAMTGAYARSAADFYTAIENAGIVRQRLGKGVVLRGLRLKQAA